MHKLNSLQDLFIEELRDLYNVETQLTKALPRMAKAARSPDLQLGFLHHLEQTRVHAERIERIADSLNASARGKVSKPMQGLVEEAEEIIKSGSDDRVKDAALIGAAQKVEHYEIAAYGTARTFARVLGFDDIATLLERSLEEERDTDEKLTTIAEEINLKAEHVH